MKTPKWISLIAALVALLAAVPAFAAVYAPIEDAELLRRAESVVLARATGSTVVAMPGGLPETRTAFAVVETFTGPVSADLEVAVPGGELPGGLTLELGGMPRFTPGALYVLALRARGDGAYVPAEMGLGSFDVVRDEAGRTFVTRSMFRSERVAVRQLEADGSYLERREPLRELAAFESYVRAELFREEPVPGTPAYVVAREAGKLTQVREGGVSALWDDHWCPGGSPGTCGTAFVRYRWVNPTAMVYSCDEYPTTPGETGVAGGGAAELRAAAALWTNDTGSQINYSYVDPPSTTCNPDAIPLAGTVPIYFDNLSMFGQQPIQCPFSATGGLLAFGGTVTDQSTHAYKGSVYKTTRAGIGWIRRTGTSCGSGSYESLFFQTVLAHVLGSTLGLSEADATQNPNDLNPDDNFFALMQSRYLMAPAPVLGSDDRDAICFLYGECEGLLRAKLFVPFVGRVAGQGGSSFSSELALTNRSKVGTDVEVEYTPSIGTGQGTVREFVGPGRQVIIPDAIAWLRSKGLAIPETGNVVGTLRVLFPGVYAYDAMATVRTLTPVLPGSATPIGKAGLAYVGVNEEKLLLEPAWLFGLRKDAADRTNISFQHAGVTADGNIKVRATWYSAAGVPGATPVERELTPGGWVQFDLATLEPAAAQGYVKVELVGGRAPWYAYAVVNDNATSDGSYIAPIKDSALRTQDTLILPVAVEAGPYATEIILDNVADVAKTMRLKWVSDQLPETYVTIDYPLAAGQQLVIPNWVQVLRDAGVVIPPKGTTLTGAIFVSVPGSTVALVSISARVLNPATDGAALRAATEAKAQVVGFYGVHYPAETRTCLTTHASWLAGLQQNDTTRTNIAIVNTGEIDGTSSTYLVEVFDGDTGFKAGEGYVRSLPWERFVQVNRVLQLIAPGVKNAYIRVTAIEGVNPFITYAVVNDGSEPGKRSGDGAYIPSEIVSVDR